MTGLKPRREYVFTPTRMVMSSGKSKLYGRVYTCTPSVLLRQSQATATTKACVSSQCASIHGLHSTYSKYWYCLGVSAAPWIYTIAVYRYATGQTCKLKREKFALAIVEKHHFSFLDNIPGTSREFDITDTTPWRLACLLPDESRTTAIS